MSKIVFVVGGSRSGKSDYAQKYAEEIEQLRYFLATCPSGDSKDEDMVLRIEEHRNKREGKGWQTIEEELDLVGAISSIPADATLLIDCLTLWLSNLLYNGKNNSFDEKAAAQICCELMEKCKHRQGKTILVSSEVGCGIVPENKLARLYRDLVGRCNQVVAAVADEVVLVSCGIPLHLKK